MCPILYVRAGTFNVRIPPSQYSSTHQKRGRNLRHRAAPCVGTERSQLRPNPLGSLRRISEGYRHSGQSQSPSFRAGRKCSPSRALHRFRRDDAFHHDLADSISYRSGNPSLVYDHADIFSVGHQGDPPVERLRKALKLYKGRPFILRRAGSTSRRNAIQSVDTTLVPVGKPN